MKKTAVPTVVVLAIFFPLQTLAETKANGSIKIGAQFLQLVYSSEKTEVSTDPIESSVVSFSTGGTELGMNIGYLLTPSIEVGGILFFGYQDTDFKQGNNTDSAQLLTLRFAPYFQYNFMASPYVMFPIRVLAGYTRRDADVSDAENTYDSFTFGGGGGVSFLPSDQGSIDLLLLCFYSIGKTSLESSSSNVDADYSRIEFGATIGLSLWF